MDCSSSTGSHRFSCLRPRQGRLPGGICMSFRHSHICHMKWVCSVSNRKEGVQTSCLVALPIRKKQRGSCANVCASPVPAFLSFDKVQRPLTLCMPSLQQISATGLLSIRLTSPSLTFSIRTRAPFAGRFARSIRRGTKWARSVRQSSSAISRPWGPVLQ
jgi:hypothetical protein